MKKIVPIILCGGTGSRLWPLSRASFPKQFLEINKEESISLVDILESEFLELEKQLTQLKTTGTGQDEVRYEKMIGEKLAYLANNVQISDFRPADSYHEVHKLLKSRLDKVGEQFEKLKNENLKNTLNSLRDKGVDIIVME